MGVWDVKEQKGVATFEGHKAAISALSFSENGYYLATASCDHSEGVKLWDLRKLKNFQTTDLGGLTGGQKLGKKPPKVVANFDRSGAYLAWAAVRVSKYLAPSSPGLPSWRRRRVGQTS